MTYATITTMSPGMRPQMEMIRPRANQVVNSRPFFWATLPAHKPINTQSPR